VPTFCYWWLVVCVGVLRVSVWVVGGYVCDWFACFCSLLLFVGWLWGFDMFDCFSGIVSWALYVILCM